jgi:hypothetical protein
MSLPRPIRPTSPNSTGRQLAAFILLPVAWWFILLYGIAPRLLPAFSTPNGEMNAFAVLSITTFGYLFEFFLALNIFRKEGYALRLRALKERTNWRWPRGWKQWGIISRTNERNVLELQGG